ncbi:MAG: O-antigen ligase family protein, partial [Terriglobales bacterium]
MSVTTQTRSLNPPLGTEWLLIALALSASALLLYPGWPVAVVLGSLCLAGGLFRWDWLLYALLFFLPMAPLLKSDLPFEDLTSVLRVVAALGLFAGYLARKESFAIRVFRNKLSVLTLAYLVVVAISALKNGVSPQAHRSLFHLLSYVIFYFGVLAWVRTTEQVKVVIRVLVVSSILVSLFAFYQFLIGGYSDFYFRLYPQQISNVSEWDGRVTSVLNYSNCLGGFMAIVAGFSLALSALESSPAWKRTGKIAFGLAAVTVVLSQSRGALAGLLAVVLLGVTSFANRWKVRIALLAGTAVVLLIAIPLLADFSQHLTVKTESVSVIGRLIVFASAGQLFVKSPVVGIGYGNFRNLMDFDVFDLQANSWDAHNLYLQVLAETGILGFLTFGTLF